MEQDQLDARNTALRDQVEDMLAGLRKQTGELKAAQAEAANATGEAQSPDGQVAVTVNATGVVTGVRFAQSALLRNTPDRLGHLVVQTIQAAAAAAHAKSAAALAPARQGMPDLPDLFPGAPSLTALNPPVPLPGRGGQATAPVPPAPPARPRPRTQHLEDDEPIGSIMQRGYQ
ncbi:YbaB/EbfC family nucleoid-associated protein [Saccharothrix sp. AJ9571]|nr:YbaB/EbfC family nucleoid-associated protein [Saccharothrix sp. AJ9571]